jgi:hypothetical protein
MQIRHPAVKAAGLTDIGELYYKFVYATPAEEWLSENELSIATMTLADIGEEYSGEIRYYWYDGTYSHGFIAYDGEVAFTISDKQPERCTTCGDEEGDSSYDNANSEPVIVPTAAGENCWETRTYFTLCFGGEFTREDGSVGINSPLRCYPDYHVHITCVPDSSAENQYDIEVSGPGGPSTGDGGVGGSGGDDGGDGGDDGGEGAPPKEPENPCENMANKSNNAAFTEEMDELSGLTSGVDYESGRSWTYDNGSYSFGVIDGQPGSNNIPVNFLNPVDGFMHTHLGNHMKGFTFGDIFWLINRYLDGDMRNPNSFTMGVITPYGIYFLKISDLAKFKVFASDINNLYNMLKVSYEASGIIDDLLKDIFTPYFEPYGAKETDDIATAERALMNALKNMDAGLTLMKEKPNGGYTKPQVDNSGNVIEEDCPEEN